MINPKVLKDYLAAIIKTEPFAYPYLDSSMTVNESLITSGSILLTYDRSGYVYNLNNINIPSKVIAKPVFKVSIIYQSLVQEDQSLIIYNSLVLLLNGKSIDISIVKPFRIIEDKLTQYKDKYGVFEHSIFFETEYSLAQLNKINVPNEGEI